nr:hypothetical protein GCM10017611_36830 [Rhodococcus wratislaviensis]
MSRPTPSESYADLGLQIAALMFHVEQPTRVSRLVFHVEHTAVTGQVRASPRDLPKRTHPGSVNNNRVGPSQFRAAVHAYSTLPLGNSTPTNPGFSIITVTKLPGVVGWVKLQPKFLRKGVKTTVPDHLSAMRQTVVSGKEWCS